MCKGTQSTTLLYALHVYMIFGTLSSHIHTAYYLQLYYSMHYNTNSQNACLWSFFTHTHQLCGDQTLISLLYSMHALDGWWWMMIYAHMHSSSLIHVTDSADPFLFFSRNKTIGLTSLANAWAALHNMYIHSTVTFYSSTILLASQFPSFRHGSCNAPINGMPYLQYLGWWGVGGELTCPSRKSPHTWGTNIPRISLSYTVYCGSHKEFSKDIAQLSS